MLTIQNWQDERRGSVEAKTFATCWQLTRTDGVILRLTDHSSPVDVLVDHDLLDGASAAFQTFYPSGGFDATARQMRPALEAKNLSIKGFLKTGKITEDDLEAGRYDDAEIVEYTIDHRFPWLGPFRVEKYWISEITFDEVAYTAKLVGISRWLKQGAGRTYGPLCDADFGDARCGFSITSSWQSAGQSPKYIIDARQKITLRVPLANQASPTYFPLWSVGTMECTSGDNSGFTFPVKLYDNRRFDSPDFVADITLQLRTPFDIETSDSWTFTVGCTKERDVCKAPFSNVINFRGFPDMPGVAEMMQSPK